MEKPLKNERMVFYVSEKLKKRMLDAEAVTGVLAVNMLVKASESICDYVEKVRAITMPFSLLPRPELEALRSRLAELEAENARLKNKK
jgi:GTP-sensing pleiotropic transcriptional regulator CodY